MTPRNVSIETARRLANQTGATWFLVIGVDDEGNYAYTTFSRTKAQYPALRDWTSRNAARLAMSMDVARPSSAPDEMEG